MASQALRDVPSTPVVRRRFRISRTTIAAYCFLAPSLVILAVFVFWPILLIYFVGLFVGVSFDRIKHMVRNKYVPFSIGKTVYNTNTKKDSQ